MPNVAKVTLSGMMVSYPISAVIYLLGVVVLIHVASAFALLAV